MPTRVVAAQVQSKRLVSDRRERIIRAAILVFHRQGYHTTTTADIAHEAGLTQSNLYNYVKSKQDVLFLVCENLIGLYDRVLEKVCEQHSDPHVRIVEALRSITGTISVHRDEVQLLVREMHVLAESDRAIIYNTYSGYIDHFETLLHDYEESSGQVTIKDKRLAANILSFIPALIPLHYWDLAPHGSDKAQDEIVSFILRGLGIPELASKQGE